MLPTQSMNARATVQRKPMQRPGMGMSGPNPGLRPGFGGSSPARVPGWSGSPIQQKPIDAALQQQQQQFMTGGMNMPRGVAVPPGRAQALNGPQPAWQQLQTAGIGGQGSVEANKMALQKIQMQQQAGSKGPGGGQPSGPIQMDHPSGGPFRDGGAGGAETMTRAGQGISMQAPIEPALQSSGGGMPQGGAQPDPYQQQMMGQAGGGATGPDGVHQDLLKKIMGGGAQGFQQGY